MFRVGVRVVLLLEVRDAGRAKASRLALGSGVSIPRQSRESVESAKVNRLGTMVAESRFVFHDRGKCVGAGFGCKFIFRNLRPHFTQKGEVRVGMRLGRARGVDGKGGAKAIKDGTG